jgi:hypothetical protein
MDINGVNQEAAAGREAWAGELPPTGSYEGVVKVILVQTISDTAQVVENRGKPKLSVGVELQNTPEGKYDGYIAYNNLNLIDSSIPYINQFLLALTDGSDSEFEEIKKAFYGGFVTDERKQHVTAIGRWKTNSPNGTLPIKVSVKKRSYKDKSDETQYVSEVSSFLVGGGKKTSTSGPASAPVEEADVDLVDEDEEVSGDSVFEDEPETADAPA